MKFASALSAGERASLCEGLCGVLVKPEVKPIFGSGEEPNRGDEPRFGRGDKPGDCGGELRWTGGGDC